MSVLLPKPDHSKSVFRGTDFFASRLVDKYTFEMSSKILCVWFRLSNVRENKSPKDGQGVHIKPSLSK